MQFSPATNELHFNFKDSTENIKINICDITNLQFTWNYDDVIFIYNFNIIL